MNLRLATYVTVALVSAALVVGISLLEQNDACGFDSCSVWVIGLALVLLAGTTILALRTNGIRLRSLAALAISFTVSITAAGTISEMLLDPTGDKNELILLAMFLPVVGSIVVFGLCLVLTIFVQAVRPYVQKRR